MGFISVLAAAAAAFIFGGVWYMSMAKAWQSAVGIDCGPDGTLHKSGSPMPFVVAIIAMILVAGMMRHIFAMAGIDSVGKGLVAGLGMGTFLISPWVAMNYAFAMRPAKLTLIDSVNAIVGCAIMGAVLMMF
ncbi:MAG: DUF1761 domain-containing protein [Rhodobacteraceae bacterium]|nr:DUF1761 domain-containing protein [Paracoccaceae bacterium]